MMIHLDRASGCRNAVRVVAAALLVFCGARAEGQPPPSARRVNEKTAIANTVITLNYSRPILRGRPVFGVLVPWDSVWNLAQDSSASIAFDHDVFVADKPLKAGTYSLSVIPRQTGRWTVMFNNDSAMAATDSANWVAEPLRFDVRPGSASDNDTLTLRYIVVVGDQTIFCIHWATTCAAFKIEAPFPGVDPKRPPGYLSKPAAVVSASTAVATERTFVTPTIVARCLNMWSALTPVDWAGPETQSPSVASSAGKLFLAGNKPRFRGVESDSPLVVLDLTGRRRLAAPNGGRAFIRPRLMTATGRIQMVWGEPNQSGSLPNAGAPVTELWWASLRDDSTWSPGKQLFSGAELLWQETLSDRSFLPQGSAYLVTPIRSTAGGGLILVRSDSAQPRATVLSQAGNDAGATVAADPSGVVLIGLLRADTTGPFESVNGYMLRKDQNSVFAMRSPDGGDSWSAPVLVSRSGKNPAYQVRSAIDRSGGLHLVWLQLQPDGKPSLVRHSRSIDNGATWSVPENLLLPDGTPSLLRIAVDRCGTVQMIVEHRSSDGAQTKSKLLYASLQLDSVWSRLQEPFLGTELQAPDLSEDSFGAIRLVAWRTTPTGKDPSMRAGFVVAQLR